MGIEKIAKIVIGTAIGIVSVVGLYFYAVKPINETERVEQVYQQALFRYADEDKDGLISAFEQDAFDRDLLKDKGVTLIHDNIPKYKDGTTVSKETIAGWIRDYKPSE